MITPLDIHNKVFGSSVFGGYGKDEVDLFLDKLSEDYEKIYKENIELKDKVSVLNEGIQHYKTMEETLQNTLVVAQNTAEEVKKNAYSKSDNIIKEAEIRASKIIDSATDDSINLRRDADSLKRDYAILRSKVEGIANSMLEIVRKPLQDTTDLKE